MKIIHLAIFFILSCLAYSIEEKNSIRPIPVKIPADEPGTLCSMEFPRLMNPGFSVLCFAFMKDGKIVQDSHVYMHGFNGVFEPQDKIIKVTIDGFSQDPKDLERGTISFFRRDHPIPACALNWSAFRTESGALIRTRACIVMASGKESINIQQKPGIGKIKLKTSICTYQEFGETKEGKLCLLSFYCRDKKELMEKLNMSEAYAEYFISHQASNKERKEIEVQRQKEREVQKAKEQETSQKKLPKAA